MRTAAILEQLHEEMRFHQCVADADRLALAGGDASRDTYIGYLLKTYGFEAPLESAISVAPELASLIDLRSRATTAAILDDLRALGFRAEEMLRVPHCSLGAIRTLHEALGWLYVAEMNRTSHQLLRGYVARRLEHVAPLTTSPAAARWAQLSTALERVRDHAADVIAAASRAYDTQHFWFSPEAPSATALLAIGPEPLRQSA